MYDVIKEAECVVCDKLQRRGGGKERGGGEKRQTDRVTDAVINIFDTGNGSCWGDILV